MIATFSPAAIRRTPARKSADEDDARMKAGPIAPAATGFAPHRAGRARP
jgi:hypothetical protein